MLRNTFCHVRGVGPKTETRLWESGIETWDQATEPGALPVTAPLAERIARLADESEQKLYEGDHGWFYELLPGGEEWRLFREFRDSVVYLDIETTGLGHKYDQITSIALYDGHEIRHYVHDDNLDQFPADLDDYGIIVTYNGKMFDVPFIREYFGIEVGQPHIDVRFLLNRLGLKGGLKDCERQLGMGRGDLDGVDGLVAVALWEDYRENDNPHALETLLAYNVADAVNLETLMVTVYNMRARETVFGMRHEMAFPVSPECPFTPHTPTIKRVKRRVQNRYLEDR